MRINKKPYVFYTNHEGSFIEQDFPDYENLKSNLPDTLLKAKDGIVTVYRTKTGQWGEWYEDWCKGEGDKLIIQKQGWL